MKKEQKRSFEAHALIFIGEVTESDKDVYQFRVVELLKGDLRDSTLHGEFMDFCSTAPNQAGEVWLVYTDILPNGKINISGCGLSRSMKSPYYFGSKHLPPPLPTNATIDDKLMNEIQATQSRKEGLIELRNEIEQIRKWN